MCLRLHRTPSRRKSGASSISALGAGTASRGHGGFVFDRLFLPLLLSHGLGEAREIVEVDFGIEPTYAERFKPFNRQEEDHFKYES